MKLRLSLLALILSACSSGQIGIVDQDACLPDDSVDDTACLQEKLNALCSKGGTLHLATGIWNISRPKPVEGSRDNASLWMDCSNVKIEGEGKATVLMMTGDGYASDWTALRIAASPLGVPVSGVEASNFTIASDQAINLNEQTHLLMLGSTVNKGRGTITDVQLNYLHLRHPVISTVSGDCLRLVGEPDYYISWVDANHIVFEECDRSGVAVQRAVRHFTLDTPEFLKIGKAAIDLEPSSTGPIEDLTFNNIHGTESTVTIAGQSDAWTNRVSISDSTLHGRLGIAYSRNVSLNNVHISEQAKGGEGSLNIRGVQGLTIHGGSVRRLLGSAPGPAIKMSGASGNFTGDIVISGMLITNEIPGHVIDAESIEATRIVNSTITGADALSSGINVRATGRDIDGLIFQDNMIRGPLAYGVRLAGGPANVRKAKISNFTDAAVGGAGLRCENPSRFLEPIIHSSYNYTGPTAVSGCTNVRFVNQVP